MLGEGFEAIVYKATSLQREIHVMAAVRHPHVVQYRGFGLIESCVQMFMEYMPGGSLGQFIARWGPLSEQQLDASLLQLVPVLDYFQSAGLIHGDLKADNILLTQNNSILKICDFGAVVWEADAGAGNCWHVPGSLLWMAPEVVASGLRSCQSDVWSLGCLYLELATAELPWGNGRFKTLREAAAAIKTQAPSIPDGVPPKRRGFISSCTFLDPCARWEGRG